MAVYHVWFSCICFFFRSSGPITRNVKDNALVLEAISGVDANDSTSAPVDDVDFTSDIGKDIKGLKIALPKEYLGEGVSEEVKTSVKKRLKR